MTASSRSRSHPSVNLCTVAELARVRTWADALIALHLDATWTFRFDNAKTRAGLCNYTDRRISVSRYLAARYEDDEIHQVLLHEVAHAVAGARAAHGPRWKAVAARAGLHRQANSRRRDRDRACLLGRHLPERPRALPLPPSHTGARLRQVRPPLRPAVRDQLAEARRSLSRERCGNRAQWLHAADRRTAGRALGDEY